MPDGQYTGFGLYYRIETGLCFPPYGTVLSRLLPVNAILQSGIQRKPDFQKVYFLLETKAVFVHSQNGIESDSLPFFLPIEAVCKMDGLK